MSFISLYSAYSGLQAARAGMDTASHNVANAGTTGYTRQRVDQASRLPANRAYGPVGTGVDIADISRSRDVMLDARARAAMAGESRFQTLGDLLAGVEGAMAEPDGGLTAALGDVWSSFEELSLNPPDTAARHKVLHDLEALASRVRGLAEAWQAAGASAERELTAAVDEVNLLLRDVAELNRSILIASSSGDTPNDLLDKRDIAVDRLSELAGVKVTITDKGAARVSLDGLALVHDTMVSELSLDPATRQILHPSSVAVAAGGSLGAYQGFVATVLPGYQAALDTFAADLAGAVNAQHAAGFTPSGAPGGAVFTYTPGFAALTLRVGLSAPGDIAAAGGAPPAAFDGVNAEALAGLRFEPAASGGTDTLNGAVRSLVGDVGSATAAAFAEADAQSAIASAAHNARTAMHGVSLDEEMVSLLTYQRAYEAAARVMTAVDQTLDTLINRTGVVGR